MRIVTALFAVALGIMGCTAGPGPPATADGTTDVTLTFYGWPDNSPPGNRIHYPGSAPRHANAGGSGTYDNPTTVAVREGSRWKPGTRMYLPQIQKYLIVEDSCSGCGTNHIDVWVGGGSSNSADVIECENALTPSGTVPVEIDPPDGKPVIAGTLC